MQLIRPVILLALAVLAPSASAAVGETAASAAVLEEETVASASGAQLSPDVAIDPADANRRVLVADEFPSGNSEPRTVAWVRSGGSWSSVSVPLPGGGGVDNRGRPTVTWGQGSDVWVAQRGRYDPGFCSTSSGVFLSRSTNRGSTWGSASLLLANKSAASPNNPAYTYDHLDLVFDVASSRPVVVADARNYDDPNCADPNGSSIAISAPWQPGDAAPANPVTIVGGGHSPSAVAVPGGAAQIVVAYASTADDRVVVSRCAFFGGLFWNCFDTTQLPIAPPQTLGNAPRPIAVDPAPDLARTADGALHLVYTAQDGADTDVIYRRSTDEGATWSVPVSVADPAAQHADQFLGTLAASPAATPGSAAGRVEVAFLDRRTNGTDYRPYSTSFQVFDGDAAPSRGANRALDTDLHAAPQHTGSAGTIADVGTRLGVAVTAPDVSSPNGPGLVWWPSTSNSSAGDIVAARLNHGTTAPSLSLGGIYTTKNVPTAVGDLLTAADDDGDPVRVSVTGPPAHGSVQGSTFAPAAGYAGPDVVSVRASDGRNTADASRLITVSNSTPVLPDAMLMSVSQGGTASLELGATDADVGDALTYAVDGNVPALLAGGVTVTPEGLLTVTVPAQARSAAIIDVRVRVTDTSPSPVGVPTGTAVARVPVKIVPAYAQISASVTLRRNGRVVAFTTGYEDRDAEQGQQLPQYRWDFGDGTTGSSKDPSHPYTPGRRYAWKLTLTMPRNECCPQPVTLSGTIDVPQAGASLLKVTQRVDRRRGRLLVTLRPKVSGRVSVGLKAGGAVAKSVPVTLQKGVARSVALALAPLQGARTADLSVRFLKSTGALAGPEPTPFTRKVRLR